MLAFFRDRLGDNLAVGGARNDTADRLRKPLSEASPVPRQVCGTPDVSLATISAPRMMAP